MSKPKVMYMVHTYAISPHGYSPDSSSPCLTLVGAKEQVKFLLDGDDYDRPTYKAQSISRLRSKDLDWGFAVAATGNYSSGGGPVITIEKITEEDLIDEWWDEEQEDWYDL